MTVLDVIRSSRPRWALTLVVLVWLCVDVGAQSLDEEIAQARRKVSELLEIYTEKHPDVVIARRALDDLMARKNGTDGKEQGIRAVYSTDADDQPAAAPPVAGASRESGGAAETTKTTSLPPPARAAAVNSAMRLRCADGSAAAAGNSLCGRAENDWAVRASGARVFYANHFDYPTRDAYLASAHSYLYAETRDGLPKLDLERTRTLSGPGASRHNWFVSEGPNERGPSWNLSFSGPGAKDVSRRQTHFYLQFAVYVEETWARFAYGDGAIKLLMLLDPSSPPFAPGEVVLTRHGTAPWLWGFRVTTVAAAYQLMWNQPWFVKADDTIYTFYDAGPVARDGETDRTDIDLFEQRWGPRRRNLDPADPDYATAPRLEGGKWYTIEVHVDVREARSVLKVWFAEYGAPPILLTGYIDSGLTANTHTYRGAFLLNRAENTRSWVEEDTFVLFDEIIVSEEPIAFPGGYGLPWPGNEIPHAWPPAGTTPR